MRVVSNVRALLAVLIVVLFTSFSVQIVLEHDAALNDPEQLSFEPAEQEAPEEADKITEISGAVTAFAEWMANG